MDVDVDKKETELNAYTRVQQVPLDTDPLIDVVVTEQGVPSLDPNDQSVPDCVCHF